MDMFLAVIILITSNGEAQNHPYVIEVESLQECMMIVQQSAEMIMQYPSNNIVTSYTHCTLMEDLQIIDMPQSPDA